jgi:phthiocerol/phenolphthiocerol synthesis type-I polyketide synthase D
LLRADDFYLFDSRMFGVSVHEANSMDPQVWIGQPDLVHLQLDGPSTAYMTACSSGMTALHAAVTALARRLRPGRGRRVQPSGQRPGSAGFAQLGVISPDGACRSFDATANGYMRSEGVFVYLVKPLAAAQRDGDRILAVVAGPR